MAIETEKKYRLSAAQVEQVLTALTEISAEFEGEDFEENILFRGGNLDEKPRVLRLRRIAERTILTFKERLPTESVIKNQIEYETEVADFGEMREILQSLGFVPALVYEKRRKTYKFRQVEIALDELPFGLFMEIEGAKMAILEAEMMLGIEDFPAEAEPYPALTAKYGTRNGDIVEARFLK